ncbi:ferredoxin [Nocardia sp. N2S4-5]|uniref:ferredoxin n=1 Tax=Nocardia sp. N2S4-5 TaxID=3351565 RepID=UPI0037D5CBD7
MKIRLDRTLCDGFGVCAKHASRHFSLDDWGYAAVEGDGTVAPADRDSVLRALLDCPVHAITELPSAESHGGTTTSKSAERISERGPTP